ncbi:unnamed protein product [Paramecium sonneborni]|uniref:Tetratricopeptide repeat protein n=1 Tax=Paramecium sonneborni TaxID=65129 RepID=A0A8S1RT85_9CILI|nr:unnamed protein product [Paramecium sonneborni]
MLDQYNEAIIWADKLLEIDPQYKSVLLCKANSLRRLGQYKEAIVWAEKVLNIDPKHKLSLYCKGECLQEQNQYSEALIFYEKFLKIQPNLQYFKDSKSNFKFKIKMNVQKL